MAQTIPTDKFFIAQIGRTIGLWGDLKFYLHTDFPEQFQKGMTFESDHGKLTIGAVDIEKGIVRFVGYDGVESAKVLTNTKLYASSQQTRAYCHLEEGQHFWFDIIGCDIREDDMVLGKVADIQRMADTDYLVINTAKRLVESGMPKGFLVPYIERYIRGTDIAKKIIYTRDAKEILETS
jgi:16S rRNA processing protein RimM